MIYITPILNGVVLNNNIYNLFILKFFDSLSIKSLDFIDKVLITK